MNDLRDRFKSIHSVTHSLSLRVVCLSLLACCSRNTLTVHGSVRSITLFSCRTVRINIIARPDTTEQNIAMRYIAV